MNKKIEITKIILTWLINSIVVWAVFIFLRILGMFIFEGFNIIAWVLICLFLLRDCFIPIIELRRMRNEN